MTALLRRQLQRPLPEPVMLAHVLLGFELESEEVAPPNLQVLV